MNEGGIPIKYGETDLPSIYEDFKDVTMEPDADSLEGEEDLFTEVNSDSELGINSNGNKRVQAIVEHAANKDKSFDDIMKDWNDAWYKAMQDDDAEASPPSLSPAGDRSQPVAAAGFSYHWYVNEKRES